MSGPRTAVPTPDHQSLYLLLFYPCNEQLDNRTKLFMILLLDSSLVCNSVYKEGNVPWLFARVPLHSGRWNEQNSPLLSNVSPWNFAQSRLFHINFHAIEQSAAPFLIAEILIRSIRVQFMINSAVRHLATMYERSLLLYVGNIPVTMAGQWRIGWFGES